MTKPTMHFWDRITTFHLIAFSAILLAISVVAAVYTQGLNDREQFNRIDALSTRVAELEAK